MLAQPETAVVFVSDETISQSSFVSELTAGKQPVSIWIWLESPEQCHSDVVRLETAGVERGKPLERETQN